MKTEIVQLVLITEDEEWFNDEVPMPSDIVARGNEAMEQWVVDALNNYIEQNKGKDNE